jgi:hypothetical protein
MCPTAFVMVFVVLDNLFIALDASDNPLPVSPIFRPRLPTCPRPCNFVPVFWKL